MRSRKSGFWLQILGAGLVIFLSVFPALAQEEDPNPDSPTPVLLSETGSTRALAATADAFGRTNLPKTKKRGICRKFKNFAFRNQSGLDAGRRRECFSRQCRRQQRQAISLSCFRRFSGQRTNRRLRADRSANGRTRVFGNNPNLGAMFW